MMTTDQYTKSLPAVSDTDASNEALMRSAAEMGDHLQSIRREVMQLAIVDTRAPADMLLDAKQIVLNHHAAPGTPLYERFVNHPGHGHALAPAPDSASELRVEIV